MAATTKNSDLWEPKKQKPASTSSKIDYEADAQRIQTFLTEFETTRGSTGEIYKKYVEALQEISEGRSRILRVDLDDLYGFDGALKEDSEDFRKRIISNAFRYVSMFETAASAVMPKEAPGVEADMDNQEVIRQARLEQLAKDRAAQAAANQANPSAKEDLIPEDLLRRFEVVLIPPTKLAPQGLREIKATHIGRLVKVRGVVTRVGNVLPRMTVACYSCDKCGREMYTPVLAKEFIPEVKCRSQQCVINASSSHVVLRVKYSKFIKYQEIRIQELSEQVPIGNVPRSLLVEARGECTRQCTPGDIVTISGVFLPEKIKSGYQGGSSASSGGLVANTYLKCTEIQKFKKSYADIQVTEDLFSKIDNERRQGEFYNRLSKSLAPEIYGHVDVKKALLLMLVGGVTTETGDGMRIRGDINVALFGDPGVAKSQLLKHVTTVAPRAVYTTGKGSSGVGLTAAVVRDPITSEMALEGGALVLADMGICCIDEFDKMEDADRTAIHEVMEQQTVSIAKAGITTTLNARTAILAAANPMYGRYNRKYSPSENINLPAALLSRFDLLFLLLDKVDADTDRALAEHVTYVHQHSVHPKIEFEAYDPQFIRGFVAAARKINPVVPDVNDPDPVRREQGRRVTNHLVEAFVEMRSQDAQDTGKEHQRSVMTPRHLLSILRLATAHARVRGSNMLSEEDVDEAIRLVGASKSSLEDSEEPNVVEHDDTTSKIFRKISEMLTSRSGGGDDHDYLDYSELEEKVLRMGFTREQLNKTLDEYSKKDINALFVNRARTKIRLV